MERFELPEGWEWRVLGDKSVLASIQPGYACGQKDIEAGAPHLRMNNVSKDAQLDFSLVRRIPREIADKAKKWLQPGDVIFNNTNSTELVGKSSFFHGWNEPCAYSNHLTRLRTQSAVLTPEWLLYCLRDLWLTKYFAINCKEFVGQSAFNTDKLKEVEIPVPPIPEQKRLVARIEAQTSRVEAICKAQRELIYDMRGTLAGFYAEIVVDAEWKPLSEVAPQVRRPVNVQLGQSYPELGIRSFGKGTFHKPAISAEQLGTKRLFHIHPGDLILNNVFAWECAVAVVKPEDAGRVGSHRFITCVPKPNVATSAFFYFHFTTEKGLHDLGDASPGGAGRNRTLGLKSLASIRVPVPSYDKQVVFARLLEKVEATRRLQAELKTDLDAYVPSILAKAFRGEL